MFKVNNEEAERRHWGRSGVFIVNFEHVSHLPLVFEYVNFKHVIAGWVVNKIVPVLIPWNPH